MNWFYKGNNREQITFSTFELMIEEENIVRFVIMSVLFTEWVLIIADHLSTGKYVTNNYYKELIVIDFLLKNKWKSLLCPIRKFVLPTYQ